MGDDGVPLKELRDSGFYMASQSVNEAGGA